MSSTELNKQTLVNFLNKGMRVFNAYAVIWFLLLLTAVYGFVAMQILAANNAQPADDSVQSQIKSTASPHIDQKVVDKLLSLQDHSVNVKTLFEEARNNPFKE